MGIGVTYITRKTDELVMSVIVWPRVCIRMECEPGELKANCKLFLSSKWMITSMGRDNFRCGQDNPKQIQISRHFLSILFSCLLSLEADQ